MQRKRIIIPQKIFGRPETVLIFEVEAAVEKFDKKIPPAEIAGKS